MRLLVCLWVVMVAGCARSHVPVYSARVLDERARGELADAMWGRVEYAPRQYAGVSYDATGVYVNLHGVGSPELIRLTLSVSGVSQGQKIGRVRWFDFDPFWLAGMRKGPEEADARPAGLKEEEFRWIGRPLLAAQAFSYGRNCWISWKALGLEGLPETCEVNAGVFALRRSGVGARFRATTGESKN